jgi:MinD-like ATPase involved in chromosome partitioning or flagellar assembly
MTSRRYVVLGLAHPRSPWFRSVAQWCNGGALPAEFVKCLGPSEVRHRLDDGRKFSALIVDAGLSGVDRDLFTAAALAGCCVIVIADPRIDRDWISLGASAVLPSDFGRAVLLDALATHGQMVNRANILDRIETQQHSFSPVGKVIAVVGSGGTGTSTVSIALAQGLAHESRRTLLADFKLHAEQAMLHDATDTSGGVQSLVDALRASELSSDQIPSFTLNVPQRGYDLLPGLRRARFWSSIRPVAFAAAFTALTHTYEAVVCDVDFDVETEDLGGSLDVEERSTMSRRALHDADAVVVVAHPSMKGLHALNRVLIELSDSGVSTDRILCVFNHAPRAARTRAGYVAALAELISWRDGEQPTLSPLHLPTREIDEALRSGEPIPAAMAHDLVAAIKPLLSARPHATVNEAPSRFSRLVPGSLRNSLPSRTV